MPASHPQRPELIVELDDIRLRLLASRDAVAFVVAGLSEEQFNQCPAPGKWSVCQCLEHLNLVADRMGTEIDLAIERAHREGRYSRGAHRYGFFESWFAGAGAQIRPPSFKRFKTFKLYDPRRDQPVANVLAAYQAHQDNLVERVEASNGIDLARVRITSPATRLVRLSLGKWLYLIVGHQERHLEQARGVRGVILEEHA